MALGGSDPVVMWLVGVHRFDVDEFEKLGLTADVLVTPIIKQVGRGGLGQPSQAAQECWCAPRIVPTLSQ